MIPLRLADVPASVVMRGDPEALGCADAIWLHTMGAARAMGLDAEIGSLEPGKRADLITLRADAPNMTPSGDPYFTVVFSAQPANIDLVVAVIGLLWTDGGQEAEV